MWTSTRKPTWWQIVLVLLISGLVITALVLEGLHDAEEREAKRQCVRTGGRPIEFNCRSTTACVGDNHMNCTSTQRCEWMCDRAQAERP